MPNRRFHTTSIVTTTKTTVTTLTTTTIQEKESTMITITHDVTQYTVLPLTFTDASGPRVLPSGSIKATVVSGEGASASIIETPDAEGVLQFSAQLVTGPTAGTYKFAVVDNTPEGDNLVINTLEIEDISTTTSVVDITPGTPEFRPKSELPAA
jgi:hypothetical protein